MAPFPGAAALSVDRLKTYLSTFSTHITRSLTSSPDLTSRSAGSASQSFGLQSRDSNWNPGSGATPPTSIPNSAVLALFGLIGAGFVITGIWFFFWAKNGGFYFREGDWEDYKSTVLRRKGPNGTTLSGATPSTNLGGGSVVGRKQRMARYKDVDIESSIGTQSEMSEIKAGRGGESRRYKEDVDIESSIGTRSEMSEIKTGKGSKDRRSKAKRMSRKKQKPRDEESVVSGMLEDDLPPEDIVRAYRHEKPARVGGINKKPDSSTFDGSTHESHSDLISNRECTPTNTPTKKTRSDIYTSSSDSPSIRKVESISGGHSGFWGSSGNGDKKSAEEHEKENRIKAEAKRLQEKGRAATAAAAAAAAAASSASSAPSASSSASSASVGGSSRRDFSYTIGDDAATSVTGSTADEERRARRQSRIARIEGSYAESSVGSDIGSDVTGTKSYPHPIPGLSEYAEERRKAREREGGYRRGK